MSSLSRRRPRDLRVEVLAGLLTSLALVPEVISFSVIAGVDPEVSLLASAVLAITMSFLGGRSAMVTAAGSVALVVAPLVSEHGVGYLMPAVILAGLLQVVLAISGFARLARHIPRSVVLGFVNSLGILIFTAQMRHVADVPVLGYALFGVTLLVVHLLPRLTRAVPSPLVAIVVVTLMSLVTHGDGGPTVGDQGTLSGALPGFNVLAVPIDAATLATILPTSLSVAFVGLIESLLTAAIVDDVTDTPSNATQESWALGVANVLAGLYGGIAGCAMIGQSIVNAKIGGARTRISTMTAGVCLLLFITTLSGIVALVPMVALAAVMMVVAVKIFDWGSVSPSTIRRSPLPETVVLLLTTAVVVVSGNLALGVGVGVIASVMHRPRRAS